MRQVLFGLLFSVAIFAQVPTRDSIAKLYVATFDRASESAGLNYWLYESNLTLEGIAKSFFDQEETKKRYPSYLTTEDFIKSVYRNLFNREPDSSGLEYWKEELDSGNISRDLFILAAINGALGDDDTILTNKKLASLYFADSGLSDARMAQFCIANIDNTQQSLNEAKKMIDDFISPMSIVDRGEDKREDYFLFDINSSDGSVAYKLDGCIFPDENTTFSYQIYSDNSAEIRYIIDGKESIFNCVVKSKFKRISPQDGKVHAPILKEFTAYDGDSGIYYIVDRVYNGAIISIEDGGSVALNEDSQGYHHKHKVLDAYKKIALSHRGIKPLNRNEHIVDYGYMKSSDRSFIKDANGDLYIYKATRCIFPNYEDTIYYFEVFDDNTMKIEFDEDSKHIVTTCGVANRYRKVYPKDKETSAPIVLDATYYESSTKRYYVSDSVYRGTIIAIYDNGALANIEDIPGYRFQRVIYDAYEIDPLTYVGRVNRDDKIEDSGYMRVKEQTSLYNLLGQEYAYMANGCDFVEGEDEIYSFVAYKDGQIKIFDRLGDIISSCEVAQKFKLVSAKDGEVDGNLVAEKDEFYYSTKTGRYYKAGYIYKGKLISIFADGQIAYIKDGKGYYFWRYISQTLEPITN